MKKFFAIVTIIAISFAGLSHLAKLKYHKHHKSKHQRTVNDVKVMAKLVSFVYEDICSKPEATVVVSALAIKEMGKKRKIDATAKLQALLKKVKKQSLRNFIQFLIADSHKDSKDFEKSAEKLLELAVENAAKVDGEKKSTGDKKAKKVGQVTPKKTDKKVAHSKKKSEEVKTTLDKAKKSEEVREKVMGEDFLEKIFK